MKYDSTPNSSSVDGCVRSTTPPMLIADNHWFEIRRGDHIETGLAQYGLGKPPSGATGMKHFIAYDGWIDDQTSYDSIAEAKEDGQFALRHCDADIRVTVVAQDGTEVALIGVG